MQYIILAAVVLLLAAAIMIKPMRRILKLLINSALGLVVLCVVKLLGGLVGVFIAINVYTLLTAALLGLPGVALILVLKLIFKV